MTPRGLRTRAPRVSGQQGAAQPCISPKQARDLQRAVAAHAVQAQPRRRQGLDLAAHFGALVLLLGEDEIGAQREQLRLCLR
jgi:hypothetical protein